MLIIVYLFPRGGIIVKTDVLCQIHHNQNEKVSIITSHFHNYASACDSGLFDTYMDYV